MAFQRPGKLFSLLHLHRHAARTHATLSRTHCMVQQGAQLRADSVPVGRLPSRNRASCPSFGEPHTVHGCWADGAEELDCVLGLDGGTRGPTAPTGLPQGDAGAYV
jgi:hypothetical protein